eukprot:jgi/Botrbrau1/136/Bobra.0022s0122.1
MSWVRRCTSSTRVQCGTAAPSTTSPTSSLYLRAFTTTISRSTASAWLLPSTQGRGPGGAACWCFSEGSARPRRSSGTTTSRNRGKMMRLETMRALANSAPDVRIECTGDKKELKDEHSKQIVHDEQVALYHNSVFCLVIPGDSQTSRRLPEAVLTGCIPVFYGPPFHTIPLGTDLDYRDFSIAFNLTEPQAWNKNVRVSWNLSMDERANERGPTDARFWIPDVPYLVEWAIQVPNLKAMVQGLRNVPAAEVQRLQAGLNAVGSRFLYMPLPSGSGNAKVSLSSLLINHMCRRAEAFKQHAAAG